MQNVYLLTQLLKLVLSERKEKVPPSGLELLPNPDGQARALTAPTSNHMENGLQILSAKGEVPASKLTLNSR